MLYKYQIDITEVSKWMNMQSLTSSNNHYGNYASKCTSHLMKQFKTYKKGAILDGKGISNIFFPTNFRSNFKVFISHSGKDKEIVKEFTNIINDKYKIPCFVDWMVWDNIKTLQEIIDKEFCVSRRDCNGNILTFDYESRNYSTAHTHAMLSMALLDMIDQCDICLFIKSENSTLPKADFGMVTTLSPWIYEEISYMNHIEKRRQYYSEGVENVPQISHPLDLDGFIKLTAQSLIPKLKHCND